MLRVLSFILQGLRDMEGSIGRIICSALSSRKMTLAASGRMDWRRQVWRQTFGGITLHHSSASSQFKILGVNPATLVLDDVALAYLCMCPIISPAPLGVSLVSKQIIPGLHVCILMFSSHDSRNSLLPFSAWQIQFQFRRLVFLKRLNVSLKKAMKKFHNASLGMNFSDLCFINKRNECLDLWGREGGKAERKREDESINNKVCIFWIFYKKYITLLIWINK